MRQRETVRSKLVQTKKPNLRNANSSAQVSTVALRYLKVNRKICINGVMQYEMTIWQVNVDRHKTNIPQYHFEDHTPLRTAALEN